MPRQLCHHCGLPIGSLGFAAQARSFCCYGCYLAWRLVGEQGQAGPAAAILARLGIAAFLSMNVMMVSLLLYSDVLAGIGPEAIYAFRWLLLALSLPVMLILGLPFLLEASREVQQRLASVNTLIAVGTLAGFGVSAANVIRNQGHIYFDTVTMLLTLLTLGRLLEAAAKVEASQALRKLLQLKPATARLVIAGEEKEVSVEEVTTGDRLRIKPGEAIPVDGVILAGCSSVQEALFTGESQPRACAPGDRLFGASINGEGELLLEATDVGEGALLARIARLVEEAQAQRAPVERLAARVAGYFVPLVLATAAGAFAYWLWRGDPSRAGMSALAVLVVACPCALGLATPLAICIAIGRAAREAVLIRAGEVLEVLSKASCIFFDKTGTLTLGRPTLQRIVCLDPTRCDENEALAWLAALESGSEHVIARAILAAAEERGLTRGQVTGFRAFPGAGASGLVQLDGRSSEVFAGTAEFLRQQGLDISAPPDFSADDSSTLLYVAWGGQVQACAALADAPRPEAAAAVRQLQQAGLQVVMLSGDRRAVADHYAAAIGIREVIAECNPLAKVEAVRACRRHGKIVAVAGDGINDAPALSEADVGIAMGVGADLAREAGGVVLLGNDLLRLPWTLLLARRTYRIIRQNLLWAFGYNLAAMALAFFGYLHPLLAALIMLGSSLVVIQNSFRLAGYGSQMGQQRRVESAVDL